MADPSRRAFLASLAIGAGIPALPRPLFGGGRRPRPVPPRQPGPPRFAPADRPLRVAFVGIGNRGNDMIKTFAATGLVRVAAFCDVDGWEEYWHP